MKSSRTTWIDLIHDGYERRELENEMPLPFQTECPECLKLAEASMIDGFAMIIKCKSCGYSEVK
jgi:hypothetical protein